MILVAGVAFGGLCLGAIFAIVILRRSHNMQLKIIDEQQKTLQAELELQKTAGRECAAKLEDKGAALVIQEREAAVVNERLAIQIESLANTQRALASAEQKNSELNDALARKESAYEHLKTSTAEQIALLSDAKKQLTDQFEQLANRIFEEKSQRFQANSRDALEVQLKPFREQLKEFRGRVDHIYDSENRGRGELK